MKENESSRIKTETVERVIIRPFEYGGLMTCSSCPYEIGGFLGAVNRKGIVYVLRGGQPNYENPIASSRSPTFIEFSNELLNKVKERYKRYEGIEGFFTIPWHTHPKIVLEGKIAYANMLSPDDINFVQHNSQTGLTALLSVWKDQTSIGKRGFLFDEEAAKNYIKATELQFYQVDKEGNVFLIPSERLSEDTPFKEEQTMKELESQFDSIDNLYYQKNEEMSFNSVSINFRLFRK